MLLLPFVPAKTKITTALTAVVIGLLPLIIGVHLSYVGILIFVLEAAAYFMLYAERSQTNIPAKLAFLVSLGMIALGGVTLIAGILHKIGML